MVLPPPEVLPTAMSARLTLQVQSLSFVMVQPGGQQPSLSMHVVMGVPPPHAPAVQVSPFTHTFVVEQAVPSGTFWTSQARSASTHWSTLQVELVGVHARGVPTQAPFMQVSLTVQ
jgi:hypothetical protein